MRLELTFDDEVVALLEDVRRDRHLSFEAAVNEALRQGLRELATATEDPPRYEGKAVSLGGCLIGNIVSVTEALALAEGDDFK